jgi:hypothetical protein
MARPTAGFPDFAMSDVTDPSSGQPNVVEPSAGKKAGGFIYNEKPPRQYLNWMQRLNALWIRYFDDSITNVFSSFHYGSFQGKVNSPSAADIIFDIRYVALWNYRVITLEIPIIDLDANKRTTDDLRLIDVAGHEMPAAIRPNVYPGGTYCSAPGCIDNVTGDVAITFVDPTAPTQLVFYKKDFSYFDKTKRNVIQPFCMTYLRTSE